VVAGAVLLGMIVLLAWPSVDTEAPVADVSIASWPARGPAAQDQSQVREAVAAWRGVAEGSGIPTPGRDVDVLYLGDPDGLPVALLRSSTREGRLLVAAGIQGHDGWRMLDAVPVDRDVFWLTLPGGAVSRALAAPEVAAAASLILRRDDGVWNRVAIRDDGVTATLRSLDGSSPILGLLGSLGAQRGLLEVTALSPTSIVPVGPPLHAASPSWGRSGPLTPEEYDAALYARPAVPDSAGQLAVVAAARVPGGRAVLVEVESVDDGQSRFVLIEPDADGAPTQGAEPVVSDVLAAGVVDRGGGRLLVLAASAPSLARVEVRSADGTTLVDGVGPTAVVLPAPAPNDVTLLGKRTNGAVVASLSVPLPKSSPGR
jgi:hypothetical protein